MTTFLQTLETFFWNVLNRPGLSDIADILIVAIIIYELLMLTRDTRGSAVLKGLAMLLLIVGISNLFGLTALNWLLMSVVNNGALVLVILFQPELRKALEQIGRGARIETKRRDTDKDEATRIIDEIIRCLQDLSRRHVGALIVFEQKTGLQDIIENGIGIDARITSGLLENIFEPNTPLHDGAIIVRGNRVVSATCYLPLSDNLELSKELGTRHRAAVGISEVSDSLTIVVSEETGHVSIAEEGILYRNVDADFLKDKLNDLRNYKTEPGKLKDWKRRLKDAKRIKQSKKPSD